MLFLTVERYLEVQGGELTQHVAGGDSWSFSVLTHTIRTSVEWRKKNKMQEEDTGKTSGEKERSATLSPNQQGASCFPTPSYATFPRQRAHG